MSDSVYSNQLRKMANLLDAGEFDKAEAMTFFSPAGDGWGLDNTCISFNGEKGMNAMDIGDVIEELRKVPND